MICTPSRSAVMSGRYAFHTGMQHSFWGTGQDGGLPLRFATMADHLKGPQPLALPRLACAVALRVPAALLTALGYSTHMVGKWCAHSPTPTPPAAAANQGFGAEGAEGFARHLGFESFEYTPLGRGFDSYYG